MFATILSGAHWMLAVLLIVVKVAVSTGLSDPQAWLEVLELGRQDVKAEQRC